MEDTNQIKINNRHGLQLHQPKVTHPNIMDLPTELHMHIASFLNYPDALALKHTSRHFYSFVYTGIYLKISWLLERFERKLECPQNEKCSFRTDESFCNKTVRKIMQRRRRHLECRPGVGGCYVVYGDSCRKARLSLPPWLEELRSWKRLGNEALTFGLVFTFWILTYHAVKLCIKEEYILKLGFCMLACLMTGYWSTDGILRHSRTIFSS